jgi:hypothetical protein
MARRDRNEGGASSGGTGLPPVYEGPEVLTALLARAGSPFDAAETAERFRDAIEAGLGRDVAVPALFEGEPHFDSPEDARRLFANLFGLWARVRAGRGAEDDAPAAAISAVPNVVAEPAPQLPPRGTIPGDVLPRALVEAAWRHLDALPPRERRRLRDRFGNVQPDLSAWVEALDLPDVGSVVAQDLAFEAWAMFDLAFGERLGVASHADLRALERAPPPLAEAQPALDAYVAEVLTIVADEEPGFGAEARAGVERALAAVAGALARALRG